MEQKTTKTSKGLIVLLAVLIALLAAAAAVWFFFVRDTGYDRYEFDTDAIAGRIQTMSEEEIQAELDRVVEEGMFNISIASAIVFESPTGEGQARIENVAANHYHMQVDIVLDETGETIYQSKLIRPGFAVGDGAFHRIPGICNVHKMDPFDNASVLHIKTRHDSQCFFHRTIYSLMYLYGFSIS